MQPEAWMRGPLQGVDPLLMPTLFSYQQVREDLEFHLSDFTTAEIWIRPHGFASVGFHLRHIAGSVDRLTTYLQDLPLTDGQLASLHDEGNPGAGIEELQKAVDSSLARSEQVIRGLDVALLREPRWVGRRRLPTTVIGLLVHLAEHTQRHLGQAIAAGRLARALSEWNNG